MRGRKPGLLEEEGKESRQRGERMGWPKEAASRSGGRDKIPAERTDRENKGGGGSGLKIRRKGLSKRGDWEGINAWGPPRRE